MTTKKSKKEIFYANTLKLIYEKGFKATTMRDIAQNSNFEVANVYNYMSSKEAFLEGYIFNILDEFNDYITDIIGSTYTPKEKLKFVISKHIQFTVKEPFQVAMLVYDWRSLKDDKLNEFKEARKAYLLKVGGIISEGIQKGQFRNMDIEIATFLVFSSLRWIFNVIIHKEKNDGFNTVELDKQICDFIFGGIDAR